MSKTIRKRGSRRTKTRKVIPPLKRGELSKFGYKILIAEGERRIALERAIEEYGYATLIRKLNALAVLNKNRNPEITRRLKRDMAFLKKYRGELEA